MLRELLARATHQGQPVGVVGPPGTGGVADVLQGGAGTYLAAKEFYVGARRVLEDLRSVRRQGQQVGCGAHSRGRWCGLGGLLQDDVGVRAGDAEGAHPGAGWSRGVGPGDELLLHRKGEVLPRDVGVWFSKVQTGRYGLVLEG